MWLLDYELYKLRVYIYMYVRTFAHWKAVHPSHMAVCMSIEQVND